MTILFTSVLHGGVSKSVMRWIPWSERKVGWSVFRPSSITSDLVCTGVNSFKMFLAYKDVFMLRDGEVCAHKYTAVIIIILHCELMYSI